MGVSGTRMSRSPIHRSRIDTRICPIRITGLERGQAQPDRILMFQALSANQTSAMTSTTPEPPAMIIRW
jgi:hypothetical protein